MITPYLSPKSLPLTIYKSNDYLCLLEGYIPMAKSLIPAITGRQEEGHIIIKIKC